jgi:hypothetical protein
MTVNRMMLISMTHNIKTLTRMTFSSMTLSSMTLGRIALGRMTLSRMTLNTMTLGTLGTMTLVIIYHKNHTYHYYTKNINTYH